MTWCGAACRPGSITTACGVGFGRLRAPRAFAAACTAGSCSTTSRPFRTYVTKFANEEEGAGAGGQEKEEKTKKEKKEKETEEEEKMKKQKKMQDTKMTTTTKKKKRRRRRRRRRTEEKEEVTGVRVASLVLCNAPPPLPSLSLPRQKVAIMLTTYDLVKKYLLSPAATPKTL